MANSLSAWKWQAWAAVLQEVLREEFVWMNIANTKFEWEFDGNTTVNFPKLTKITALDLADSYSSVTVQNVVEANETFTLDQRKHWAYELSEEDLTELRVSPENQLIKDWAEAFADAWDVDIFSEYWNASYYVDAANVWSTAWSSAVLTKSNIYQFIVEVGQTMDENNIPSRDRKIVFSPVEKALLLQCPELVRSTADSDRVVRTWMVWTIDSFDIFMSNNLQTASSTKHALAVAWNPICFAANIRPKVQITPAIYRDSFSNLVKAQTKFWVKTFSEGANRLIDLRIAV